MRAIIVGEAMLEFHGAGTATQGLRYGGDTLNTAIHMARFGCDAAYVTALGSDPLSDALVATWTGEGLDTHHVLRHPTRQPGIYAIHIDDAGERSFLYWRDQSAARDLFSLPGLLQMRPAIEVADLLYFSHISLAILPPEGRAALLDLAWTVRRRGGQVAYDSNFRPRLWENIEAARQWSERAMALATIGLPTADDERILFATDDDDRTIARRWIEAGCREVAVKCGAAGCVLAAVGQSPMSYPCSAISMVDSSGAGDAFNAGYLASRLHGEEPLCAAENGHRLAAWVITRPGALPGTDGAAPYPFALKNQSPVDPLLHHSGEKS